MPPVPGRRNMGLPAWFLLVWGGRLLSVIWCFYEGCGISRRGFVIAFNHNPLRSSAFKEADESIATIATMYRFTEVKDGKCFFPFYYKGGRFYDCVKFKAKRKWCSINETYEGYWKYCEKEDFAKCVFPFWFKRMIYWECTDDSDAFGKKWCSMTKNYNKDQVWKYCDS